MKHLRLMLEAPEYKEAEEQVKEFNKRAFAGYEIAILFLLFFKLLLNFSRGLSTISVISDLLSIAWVVFMWIWYQHGGKDLDQPKKVLYAGILPVLAAALFTGTVIYKDEATLTYFLLMLMPVIFITDVPAHLMVLEVILEAVFLALCVCFKNPAFHSLDAVHSVEFFLGALVILFVTSDLKRSMLRGLLREKKAAETDETTGLYNSYAMHEHARNYLNQDIVIVCGVVDYYRVLLDQYGEQIGERIMKQFGEALRSSFPEKQVYISRSGSAAVYLKKEDDAGGMCRQCLKSLAHPAKGQLALSAAFGHVSGSMQDTKALSDMEHLAYLNARILQSETETAGSHILDGGVYSPEKLREATSSISGKADESLRDRNTGLLKFTPFLERSAIILNRISGGDASCVFLYIDLENFKQYNRSYGYEAGNDLLRKIAEVLKDQFPARLVCHVGGDHFIVFCYRDEVPAAISRIPDEINTSAGRNVNVRIGAALYHPGEAAAVVCDNAKAACDSLRGSSTVFCWYDDQFRRNQENANYLKSHVKEACEKGWIIPYYQPIISTQTGKRACMEALARWIDPVRGFMPPGSFIPVLEDAQLTDAVDLCILKHVVTDMKEAEEKGIMDLPAPVVSVNFSRNDLIKMDLVKAVNDIVTEAGVSPTRIAIEITESAFTQDLDVVLDAVNQFHALGYQVWMDDFGSGYSSLSLLQNADFNVIKMDMMFMRNLDRSPESRKIVKDLVHMINHMNSISLCEGAETKEQTEFLKECECGLIQGFFYGKPEPLAHYEK
ncbi:MAG: EAL domain-containing protein [Bulleidia sp.]|nr:EAL domain-containing protein [Bulleidia sp.]